MWGGKNKVLYRFTDGVIAVDAYTGEFLNAYLRHALMQRLHTWQMEVIDLQRYKVIKKPKKVFQALREQANEPFVFIVCKN